MNSEIQARVIKRYANRKLYDTADSCYITQDEVARLVREGEEVRIIDNKTKEDITPQTLTQILVREDQEQRRTLPLSTLKGILQSGGDFLQRKLAEPVASLRDEAEETVRSLGSVFMPKDEESETVADASEETSDEEALLGARGTLRPTGAIRDWGDNMQRSFESMQRTLEDRWSMTFNALRLLDDHERRISQLESRITELEAELKAAQEYSEEKT